MQKAATSFDAIVVGSGASGGWAAKRLAEAGVKVAMLDAGRVLKPEEYKEHVPAFDLKYRNQGRDAIRRTRPVEVRDVEFLRSITDRRIKITVPGPFTMTHQAQNDHYPDLRSLALAYAEAVNEELRDLVAVGADVVQIDEPYLQARPDDAREYALEAIARAFEGVDGTKALHTCFGYAAIVHEKPNGYPFLAELDSCPADEISIEAAQPRLDPSILEELPSKRVILGVLDLGNMNVESAELVAERIRAALRHIDPERLMVGPDCGMKYLPRDVASGKLHALVEGAISLR